MSTRLPRPRSCGSSSAPRHTILYIRNARAEGTRKANAQARSCVCVSYRAVPQAEGRAPAPRRPPRCPHLSPTVTSRISPITSRRSCHLVKTHFAAAAARDAAGAATAHRGAPRSARSPGHRRRRRRRRRLRQRRARRRPLPQGQAPLGAQSGRLSALGSRSSGGSALARQPPATSDSLLDR